MKKKKIYKDKTECKNGEKMKKMGKFCLDLLSKEEEEEEKKKKMKMKQY